MENYREFVESLEEICNEDDSTELHTEEVLSPQELLKDIVASLHDIVGQISTEDVEYDDLIKKLQKARDILCDVGYNESCVEEDISSDSFGTKGMGPKIDKDGKQNYDNPKGASYAARHGFVGI